VAHNLGDDLSHTNPLAIIAALIAGTLVALQSRLNGELGLAIGDGVGAALYSFTSGWILIAIVHGFSPKLGEPVLEESFTC
jgi:bacterial/archaeal transporter family-2 protein